MSMLGRVDKLLGYLDNLDLKIDLSDARPLQSQPPSQPNASASNAPTSSNFKPSADSMPGQVMSALSELNITVSAETHKAVHTSEEHRAALSSLDGVLVKNLLVSEKRIKKKRQFLIMMPANKPNLNLKAIGKEIVAKLKDPVTGKWTGGGLRGVSDPDVTFKVQRGGITPLAVIWDAKNLVQVILDEDLRGKALLVHPGTNEATVQIQSTDLEAYLNKFGNPAKYLALNDFFGSQQKAPTKAKSSKTVAKPDKTEKEEKTGVEKEGITKDKYTQFGDWYKEIVTKCELIDYTDISGCYVLRPPSYFIWEQIQSFMDNEIKKMGVRNAYFPIFVSEDALKAESKHFEDFCPEVAWVTHSGDTPLDKKIAVRPTSETIMYPIIRRWIRSFRDLPLKVNQWCNVVRWEFSNPTPFLRTREFLWQEGHTCHATRESAEAETYEVLDMYARTYKEVLAVPTIKGRKTKLETFPGADYSLTVEGYIPGSGRGIQGATSHCLGTHFSDPKMFDIKYLNEKNKPIAVIQNSWGFTTRAVGVAVMNHSDNRGLVLPPSVAQTQCVFVPIYKGAALNAKLDAKCAELADALSNLKGIRCAVDDRKGKKPGFKFNEWELKGVPLRVEVGKRDLESGKVVIARRDEVELGKKGKKVIDATDLAALAERIDEELKAMHCALYEKALRRREENIETVTEWKAFLEAIQNGKIVMAPHCGSDECEEAIAKETTEWFAQQKDLSGAGAGMSGKAKALCIPLEQKSDLSKEEVPCFHSPKCRATKWILFGRSY